MKTRFRACHLIFGGFIAALPSAALAEIPTQLTSVDPLTLPRPSLVEPLRFEADTRTSAERIQTMLWEEALRRGADAEIPIIVTLQEPLLPTYLRGATEQADRHREQWVAESAHEFAAEARAKGVTNLRALSHFPIVFGTVRASRLLGVASIRGVQSIRADEAVTATRVQGSALMNATNLRNLYNGAGSGRGIAIFDTGVDVHHPEFAGRPYVYGNYSSSPGVGDTDVQGHGTACAGIALGFPGGMAPLAKLWTIKVLNDDMSGSDSQVLSGLNAVYSVRTQFGGVHVLSLSLGGAAVYNSNCDGLFPDFASVFSQFNTAGIPIFVASGNGGFIDGVSKPACLSSAISVGAVFDANVGVSEPFPPAFCTDSTTAADQITCYSNSGIPLDILAPSHDANTTIPGGGYTPSFGGTSAACPYAAGVAAQILSLVPLASPAQLRTALMSTGHPITDVNGITRNRIDAVQAYQALASGGGCVEDTDTACLLNDRFKIEIQWTDFENVTRTAFRASSGTSDSALFYWTNPNNWEVLIKAINACGFNNKFWIYFAAATNVGYRVTVTDTVAGGSPKVYTNPLGNLAQATNDINAFPCP